MNAHHFFFVRYGQPKRTLPSTVNLTGKVVAGFLVLERLLKFINDSLTLVEGNPDFSEIHCNDGVSVSLVVNGQKSRINYEVYGAAMTPKKMGSVSPLKVLFPTHF